MKLVALVIAGNSSDVVESCIEHHRALGVDAFVVFHAYSEDDTPERLRELARQHDDIHVMFAELEDMFRGKYPEEPFDFARTSFHADWMIPIDCDERWIVRNGSLKDILAQTTHDALTIPRYNVVWPTPEQAQHSTAAPLSIDGLPIAAFPVEVSPERFDTLGIPWILTRVAPKCCVRAHERLTFSLGGHLGLDRQSSAVVPHGAAHDLLVAQLVYTTLERFERKARFASWYVPKWRRLFGGTAGWHWERLGRISDQGPEALRAEWARQFLSPGEARDLVGRDVIVEGRKVFEVT